MKEKIILISGAVVYKRKKGEKPLWFLVRLGSESNWEIPKTTARRGESSVRASIRAMGEQGGMRAKVLEEVGRSNGTATISGRPIAQRTLYYLMVCKEQNEVLGYEETEWMTYAKAVKRLESKREASLLKKAKEILGELDKKRKERKKLEEQAIAG
ncbi:MAG: NUDIX domain-containing protein [Candidatus Woesebacteria bacterium]|nr:MAG: NUDIX domain-containing protein [Candidatus Woesebacteria bacterium]